MSALVVPVPAVPYSGSAAYSGQVSPPSVSVDLSPTGANAKAIAAAGWQPIGPPAPTQPVPVAPVPYSNLSWWDEFDGTDITGKPLANPAIPDPARWEDVIWYEKPNAPGSISDENGGVADPTQLSVANGVLTLSAYSNTPLTPGSWHCGYVDTAPFYAFQAPGYVEIKAMCPNAAPGWWPALVMYEDGLKGATQYAELDILEAVDQPPSYKGQQAWQTWHPAGSGAPQPYEIGGLGINLTGWHTYAVSVDASGNIQFWFDATPTGKAIAGGANATEFMFINLTMSTGGTANDGWAGVPAATPTSAKFLVDYVRVFK